MQFSAHEHTGVGSGISFGRTILSVFFLFSLSDLGEFSATLGMIAVGFLGLGDCRPYARGFLFIEIPSLIPIIG